jgi:hypothetical protein
MTQLMDGKGTARKVEEGLKLRVTKVMWGEKKRLVKG